jgi:hypothetical protein
MAYFRNGIRNQRHKQPLIAIGDGENTFYNALNIKPSEASYSRNTTSKNYPAMSVRNGRTKSFATDTSAISTPKGLGQRNDTYPHVQDGATWKRWDGAAWQTVATLESLSSKFLEFNTDSKRYTINAQNSTSTNKAKMWDGSSVTILTDAPQTRLMTVDDYRIFAVKDSVLYWSDISDPANWTTGDSSAEPITSMIGVGSAIATFNDQVIVWSNQTMHILMGNDTEDFQFSNNGISSGCISDRTVLVDNGTLYYLDFGQFNAYTGGYPVEISQKVRAYLEAIPYAYRELCCAGKKGKYIYLSIPYGAVTANNITLQYDTLRGNWYVHDYGVDHFTNIGEDLYAIDASGFIWKVDDSTATTDSSTAITWSHITGAWLEEELRAKKVISDIYILCDLPSGSTLNVAYSETIDNNDFTSLYDISSDSDEQNVRVQIPTSQLYGVDYYRLKFSGSGPCTIHYIDVYLRVKAR